MYVEYNSNNSGRSWWLKDKDWKKLEKAGWVVVWSWLSEKFNESGNYVRQKNGMPKIVPSHESGSSWDKEVREVGYRWIGALAKKAYKPNCKTLAEAVEEWEKLTGACSTDAGCACCGQPHRFTLYDNKGKEVASGPSASYSASW